MFPYSSMQNLPHFHSQNPTTDFVYIFFPARYLGFYQREFGAYVNLVELYVHFMLFHVRLL
jgi:hypothetical protein